MSYDINELLATMVNEGASDLHITAGVPPIIRLHGDLKPIGEEKLTREDIDVFLDELLIEEEKLELLDEKDIDLCISKVKIGRFRLNVFEQRNSRAIAFRHINDDIPDLSTLGLPESVKSIANKTRGLFLVTGPTGSGKSTTLASIIDKISRDRRCHIITLEDPIEYLHKHKNSIINQREIGADAKSYARGLRAALREDPDVVLIGEMRDLETISTALTAAETGHFVLATLHTIGAPKSIDRIIDVFPPHQQSQVRSQLASILVGILSQILLPRIDIEGRVPACELLIANDAIRNMIRENKGHQIYSTMQTGQKEGMLTLDNHLVELYKAGIISREDALIYCMDPEYVKGLLQNFNSQSYQQSSLAKERT